MKLFASCETWPQNATSNSYLATLMSSYIACRGGSPQNSRRGDALPEGGLGKEKKKEVAGAFGVTKQTDTRVP